ncbi:MAG TPA: hypothetical protein VMV59_03880 [Candidatus Dormibacteraeota bacterium]|nr:hypothetical protein [Candidatus Dormibacteraeota bacterium]
MKATRVAVTLAFCLLAAGVCFAQNPFIGTWKLNDAKSKFGSGATKNTTVTYEVAGDNITVTVDGVDSAGSPVHNVWTGKFDGKAYPLTGGSEGSTRSYRKIGIRTLAFTERAGGKITTFGRIVVSADGKTRTVTSTATDASGKKIHSVAVYDKQ